jgi:hypothetical protein
VIVGRAVRSGLGGVVDGRPGRIEDDQVAQRHRWAIQRRHRLGALGDLGENLRPTRRLRLPPLALDGDLVQRPATGVDRLADPLAPARLALGGGHRSSRMERLSNSPTSDEAMRFLTELRCEKLRPELFRLTERLDYQAPTAADAAIQSPSSWVAPAQVGRWRATEPQNKTHWSVSSRSLQPRRHANRGAAPSLPPILLALLGEQPRNSTAFRRARTSGGSGRGAGGGH